MAIFRHFLFVFASKSADTDDMQYEELGSTMLVFDTNDEIQALTWAVGDMRRAEPDNPIILSAYQSALEVYDANVTGGEDVILVGEQADAILATMKVWAEGGPPHPRGQMTDAARTKSYKTACAMLAQVLGHQQTPESDS